MENKLKEDLRQWHKEKWKRIDSQGNISGDCGTMKDGEHTKRCLPLKKAQSLSKAERKATVDKKVKGDKKGKQFVDNTEKSKVTKDYLKRENVIQYLKKRIEEVGKKDRPDFERKQNINDIYNKEVVPFLEDFKNKTAREKFDFFLEFNKKILPQFETIHLTNLLQKFQETGIVRNIEFEKLDPLILFGTITSLHKPLLPGRKNGIELFRTTFSKQELINMLSNIQRKVDVDSKDKKFSHMRSQLNWLKTHLGLK